MFSSLRSRLWLSYSLLIVTALSIVAVSLFFSLIRSPFFYRQTIEQLKAVGQVVIDPQQNPSVSLSSAEQAALKFNVRIVLFSQNQQVVWDTNSGKDPVVKYPVKRLLFSKLPLVRDGKGNAWLYSLEKLSDDTSLMVATPRPRLSLLNAFTGDLLPIFFQSGLIALVLSLIFAFIFARWLADPLQKMMVAARGMPSVEAKLVEVQGPHEVQELMRAFNAMVARTQASQKSQRDFVANVSHELKTPLTSIQGFSQAILDGTAETDAERKQAAQIIYDESGRMHRLVLDLLDLARLDSGTADITMTSMNIMALLNSVAEKFTPQSHKAGVDISVKIQPNLPTVMADGDRLSQVFTNLVDNALKFTPQGGSIQLQASVVNQEMKISVVDSGVGMTPEVQAHIFERFYQADASRKGGEKHGAGLGLAIAHEIVQAHGGRISVRSRLGEGTAFEVFLPLTKK
ncbi:MAG: HAMP domain-containing sensor histidine kinase [Anaerolineales bacterium]